MRMALGAQRVSILELVLSQGARLIGIGIAIGIGVAFLVARSLTSLLYGVKPHDLPTLLGASVVLGLLGLLACAVPALRATQVDPIIVLRNE